MTDPHAPTTLSRLTVRSLRALYLVDADHPAPARVKSRLDDSLRDGLSRALGAAAAPALPESDTGVWFVRRLEVGLDVNAAWERDAIRRAFALRFALELDRTIRDGPDGRDVVWFPDRAAYLAGFLVDRCDGHGSQWFYEPFAGLRLLSVSAALRSAVCDDPRTGLTALLSLAPDALQSVLRALTAPDARGVLDVLASAEPDGSPVVALDAALAALDGLPETSLDGDEARDSLRLYLAGYEAGSAAGRALRDAAVGLLRLSRFLTRATPFDHARALSAISREDLSEFTLAAGATVAEALAPYWSVARAELAAAVEAMAKRGRVVGTERDGPRAHVATWFGGAFFLLPALDELPLGEAVEGWPDADRSPARSVVGFLILLKCLGSDDAPRAFHDPLLRDLFGIDPGLSPGTLIAWQAGLSARARERFRAALGDWHVGRGSIALGAQILARVGLTDETPVAVLIDAGRGVWRTIEKASSVRADRTVRRFRSLLAGTPRGSLIVADPDFAESIRDATADHPVLTLTDPLPEGETELRELLARLDRLPDDLAFLSLPAELGVSAALDRTLSVASQGVLRNFAWRLPGFARSHFSYLRENFLVAAATLEDRPDRRVVSVGRPPLSVILNMTGISRASYRLSWLDDKPFALFPEP